MRGPNEVRRDANADAEALAEVDDGENPFRGMSVAMNDLGHESGAEKFVEIRHTTAVADVVLPERSGFPASTAPGARAVTPVPRLEISQTRFPLLHVPFQMQRPSPLVRPDLS